MAWVRIDDELPQHPKIEEAGPLAMAMQVAALCYANRYLTDGKLPSRVVAKFMPTVCFDPETGEELTWRDIAASLVEAGIWVEADGGYVIHDYLDYQPSKADVEAVREKRSEAGRKGGQARRKQSAKQTPSNDPSQTEAKSNPKPNPKPKPNSQEKDSTRATAWPEESIPYRLADRLRTCILERDPSTKVPSADSKQFESWCVEADRLIRLDERDPEEAERLIQWAQNDDFWSANILSMGKFRKQYDKLKRRAQSEATVGNARLSRDPPDQTPLHRRMRERGKIL